MKTNTARKASVGQVFWYALGGFFLGFFVLHPLSMVIFRSLDPRFVNGMRDVEKQTLIETILYTFSPNMIPMGLVYGMLVAIVVAVAGYHRSIIKGQTDVLTQQVEQIVESQRRLREHAELLKQQNEQLTTLEQINRRNTQFMVHDLKTPLACILGFTNLLLEEEDCLKPREIGHALRVIKRQSRVMTGDLQELLDFARIQETSKIHRERTPVRKLLLEAINDFELPEHLGVTLIGENAGNNPPIRVDKRLLRRVLVNLISNAIKHNGLKTRVVLDVETGREESELLFSCRDDGDGIPDQILPSIFDDFSARRESKPESTGLGLAFCKAAVEAHGGNIWCVSKRGEGTCVYFTILNVEGD